MRTGRRPPKSPPYLLMWCALCARDLNYTPPPRMCVHVCPPSLHGESTNFSTDTPYFMENRGALPLHALSRQGEEQKEIFPQFMCSRLRWWRLKFATDELYVLSLLFARLRSLGDKKSEVTYHGGSSGDSFHAGLPSKREKTKKTTKDADVLLPPPRVGTKTDFTKRNVSLLCLSLPPKIDQQVYNALNHGRPEAGV